VTERQFYNNTRILPAFAFIMSFTYVSNCQRSFSDQRGVGLFCMTGYWHHNVDVKQRHSLYVWRYNKSAEILWLEVSNRDSANCVCHHYQRDYKTKWYFGRGLKCDNLEQLCFRMRRGADCWCYNKMNKIRLCCYTDVIRSELWIPSQKVCLKWDFFENSERSSWRRHL